MSHSTPPCPDCDDLSRRDFIHKTAAAAVVAPALAQVPAVAAPAKAAASPSGETLVTQLYRSLTEEQTKKICFDFNHPLRSKVDNNWHVVDHRIANTFNPDQQDLIKQIFLSLHSPEYARKVYGQVQHDSGRRGFNSSSVALFGKPGTGKFEFVFTGRHVTRRCDGDSVEGAAFGGPIFYGHAAQSFNEKPDHPGNVYWFQAVRANEVFQALDGKQRKLALRTDSRRERGNRTVQLSGKTEGLPGVPCGDMTADQKALVREVLADLLAPFREKDRVESMKLIDASGGVDSLAMAFYKHMDVGDDGVWDVWQVQGPNMIWYFRGKPHVHTWVNIRAAT